MVTKIMVASLFLLAASCQSSRPTQTFGGGSEKLYAHRWTLSEVDGHTVTPAGTDRDAHLLFATPNRVTGSTGCNRLTGTFELMDGNKIRFAPLATTRMMCPDADNETRFTRALGTVETYSVTEEVLTFSNSKTVVARFKASPVQSGN